MPINSMTQAEGGALTIGVESAEAAPRGPLLLHRVFWQYRLQPKPRAMLDQMVINKCSAAMQADFDKAGKTPPAGLIQQTCGCVAQQLDATHNLEMAKTVCMEQATAGM